jgi:hypothetical protein
MADPLVSGFNDFSQINSMLDKTTKTRKPPSKTVPYDPTLVAQLFWGNTFKQLSVNWNMNQFPFSFTSLPSIQIWSSGVQLPSKKVTWTGLAWTIALFPNTFIGSSGWQDAWVQTHGDMPAGDWNVACQIVISGGDLTAIGIVGPGPVLIQVTN